jgi:DNA-binding HxlR family transcriptional regulator
MERIVLDLFRFRWNASVLAELFTSDGAKFVTLVAKLGISRSVLRSTLKYLIGVGLVAPNPGYGHPLRPEYLLTPAGREAAPFCLELISVTRHRDQEFLLQSKWAFPLLFALDRGEMRFSELKALLAPITPKALSEELKRLVETNLVRRTIVDGFPPVSMYAPTPQAGVYGECFRKRKNDLPGLAAAKGAAELRSI